MKKKISYFVLILLGLIVLNGYYNRIGTNSSYCGESPTVRWKFAIYCGECNDETGCNYIKVKGTGVLEYFGFKKINKEIN